MGGPLRRRPSALLPSGASQVPNFSRATVKRFQDRFLISDACGGLRLLSHRAHASKSSWLFGQSGATAIEVISYQPISTSRVSVPIVTLSSP